LYHVGVLLFVAGLGIAVQLKHKFGLLGADAKF
jgi:hypothetical protein